MWLAARGRRVLAAWPLLGERLQHRVLYLPPTRDGAPVDLRDTARFQAALDEQAWLTALDQREVDLLFMMVPPPAEARWAQAHPERFRPLVMWNAHDPALVEVLH